MRISDWSSDVCSSDLRAIRSPSIPGATAPTRRCSSWSGWSRTASARIDRMTGRRTPIESLSNPLIKRMRLLREKRHRRAEGLFLAEGLRIATEAREAGILPQWLFLGPEGDTHPLAAALVADTLAAGGEVIDTTGAILSKLSGKDNPQTVVGIYAEPETTLADLDRDAAPIWLVAERLRDPGNLGTMLRTGDAVGAGGQIRRTPVLTSITNAQ